MVLWWLHGQVLGAHTSGSQLWAPRGPNSEGVQRGPVQDSAGLAVLFGCRRLFAASVTWVPT